MKLVTSLERPILERLERKEWPTLEDRWNMREKIVVFQAMRGICKVCREDSFTWDEEVTRWHNKKVKHTWCKID